MRTGWGRWRGYMDELEDVMRLAGEHLAECEAVIAETWERAAWRNRQFKSTDTELLRRALDIPFFRRLIEAAWRVGPDAELAAQDFSGREWEDGEATTETLSADRAALPTGLVPESPALDASPPARLRAAERALELRSRSLVVLLDNLVDSRNASAIVRTSESLGLQEVNFIQAQGRAALERSITMRADRWMDLRWHRSPETAIEMLRDRGYRILVSDFSVDAQPLEEVELSDSVAIAFGSEQSGVGDALRDAADGFFYLPSAGFTAYINVSVMAGIALYALDRRMREEGLRRPLSEDERATLRRAWYSALARGNRGRAARYLGWLDHPPEPAPPRGTHRSP
jgi:tRNA (guanosine-2'-O-)-methyltransferase